MKFPKTINICVNVGELLSNEPFWGDSKHFGDASHFNWTMGWALEPPCCHPKVHELRLILYITL